jgi:hypothetical protein
MTYVSIHPCSPVKLNSLIVRRLLSRPAYPGTGTNKMIPVVNGAAQHSTAQHSTAQHSTAQHSTAQHSTAQHSTAQHSLCLASSTCSTSDVIYYLMLTITLHQVPCSQAFLQSALYNMNTAQTATMSPQYYLQTKPKHLSHITVHPCTTCADTSYVPS